MNAYATRAELALHPARSARNGEHFAAASASGQSLFTRVSAFFRQRATLAELRQLTDRELADIGLQRAELNRVFDPNFVARRAR